MKRALRLRPELVDDVHAAFAWYEASATGLGHEFLRSYFNSLSAVERHPTIPRKVHGDFRRVLLSRFPYAVYFRVERRFVTVFLLTHGARDPWVTQRLLVGRAHSGA